MNEGWRTTLAALTVVVATLSAVFLLWQNPSHYGAAIALMVGAILIAIVLSSTPLLSNNRHRFSSHDYKNLVASVISLGGGVVVAFSLVFILLKITGYSWTNSTPRETLSEAISLPLIVIVGVTVLLIVIALVTYTFSVIGLSSGRDALGLPDGSVRAIIALMLLVLFSILSIFLYNSIASRPVQTITHVSEGGIDDLRSHAVVIVKEIEPPADNQGGGPSIQAAGAATGPTYKVTFRELTGPADDIAKQLIVMLGTLVTAVASFYFGSASVASANAAVLGQRRSEPSASSVSPNPITATGQSQTLMIGGSDLAGTTKLHLEQKDQPDINATLVKASDNLLTVLISIQSDRSGTWNVVTDDGSRAVTIGTIEIASPAASVTEPEKPVDPSAAGGAGDASLPGGTDNPAIAAALPGAQTPAGSGKPVEKISANGAINTPLPGSDNNRQSRPRLLPK